MVVVLKIQTPVGIRFRGDGRLGGRFRFLRLRFRLRRDRRLCHFLVVPTHHQRFRVVRGLVIGTAQDRDPCQRRRGQQGDGGQYPLRADSLFRRGGHLRRVDLIQNHHGIFHGKIFLRDWLVRPQWRHPFRLLNLGSLVFQIVNDFHDPPPFPRPFATVYHIFRAAPREIECLNQS